MIITKKFNRLNLKNVLFGKYKSRKNCSIGHNTIVENNVIIGNNWSHRNNVIIRNTIIGNNTKILMGNNWKRGFGFFPDNKNIRYPYIGSVIIGDNVEIEATILSTEALYLIQ